MEIIARKIMGVLLLTSAVISFDACELFFPQEDTRTELEKLPPPTKEGKNTFGCLVDGKAWVIKTSIDARAFYQSGVVNIGAHLDGSNLEQGIGFYMYDPSLSEQDYLLSDTNSDSYAQFGDYVANCGYETTATYTGTMTITFLDQSNYIIAGTFEFEAYSADCGKVVKITKGRFDLNYAP